MIIFWTLLIGALLGYVFGHYIKPNYRLQKAIIELRQKSIAALEEGNKGIYKTVVTEHNQSSELVVEVKELAVTQTGLVKVEYLSAQYKNPVFRTKKGEALLREVHDLLGEYLPLEEIEWYETTERHENIKKYLHTLDTYPKNQFGT
ncbi:spore cortex formation protein SpoVR/YcgB (stage V sporulation) [Pontibacter aydingkolensis]|uniref:YhcB family protein n=1 Tax=Pontibacter aydingkolensis TaxID=1911536 RepID=A0ABS7CYJ8_9BACT|nr:YhcB family protein [Pontibacter aydingkolensis]MBW7468911.1 YhcB family protein [Pontibacter aydingkolensis]